jgi:coenzyme F420-dependent glucose-6-phosphate dehydrogenase
LRTCHEQWRHAALDSTKILDLPTPMAFDAATAAVGKDELKTKMRLYDDFDDLWERIERDAALGFERIYLHHIGRDMSRFLGNCKRALQ